jgi:hypothetical protein
MRKIVSLVVVVIFIVGLSGCKSRDRCPSVGKVEMESQEIIS